MELCDIWGGQPPKAIVIGGSAGASGPLRMLLSGLDSSFPAPIILVQHLHESEGGMLAENLDLVLSLPVRSVEDKMPAEPGALYVSPADYHLLVEREGHFALSLDEPVRWSRPSIDVLFECAASVWGKGVMAVLLSGANEDGMNGLLAIRRAGGLALVQDPATAQFPFMPQAAIDANAYDLILPPEEISGLLKSLLVKESS